MKFKHTPTPDPMSDSHSSLIRFTARASAANSAVTEFRQFLQLNSHLKMNFQAIIIIKKKIETPSQFRRFFEKKKKERKKEKKNGPRRQEGKARKKESVQKLPHSLHLSVDSFPPQNKSHVAVVRCVLRGSAASRQRFVCDSVHAVFVLCTYAVCVCVRERECVCECVRGN